MILGSQDIHALLIEDLMGCNVPSQENHKSLNILLKVLENIKNYPEEIKYRGLKTENPAIAAMLSLQGAYELLSSCGFRNSGENMLQYTPSEGSEEIILKIFRMLGPRVRTMQVVSKIQPNILKMVNERKAKMEAERAYKQKLVNQIQSDRYEYQQKNKKY